MQVGLLQELAFAIRNLQRTERCLGDGLGRFQLLFELPYSRFQLKGSACPGGCLAVREFSPHANDAVLDYFEVVNPYNARIIRVHPDVREALMRLNQTVCLLLYCGSQLSAR